MVELDVIVVFAIGSRFGVFRACDNSSVMFAVGPKFARIFKNHGACKLTKKLID